jgi:hypothetical protein
LDWLSSFALFLRFLPPSAPLDQAVAMFQQAFESGEQSLLLCPQKGIHKFSVL